MSLNRKFLKSQAECRMRAQMKKRQRMRRITILVTVLIIAVSLGAGVYFLTTSPSTIGLDSYINEPVSSADMGALVATSGQPYGPTPPLSMQSSIQSYSGAPFVSGGKPTVVFIGGEDCPYCAIERWALVTALMRFGSFTGLHYMTSIPNDVGPGDYATFTFAGSSYTSQYIAFRGYEVVDRSGKALQSVPSNYSAAWQAKTSGGTPFMNFGNLYVAAGSVISDPTVLTGKNWTTIINDISTSDGTGVQIREGANLITAVICKLTQGAPLSVCSASPIGSVTSSISGPAATSLSLVESASPLAVNPPTVRPFPRRLG